MSLNGWTRFDLIARAAAGRPAFIGDEGLTSFAQLRHRALCWAGRKEMRELEIGARVVIWSPNSVAMAAAVLGAWARGAAPVLLGAQTPIRHLVHAAEVTGASLLAADPVLATGAPSTAGLSFIDLDAPDGQSSFRPYTAGGAEPASIVFTSGSTGRPKGVTQTHASLQGGNDAVAGALGIGAADRLICGLPWSFDYGWGQLLLTLLSGVPQVLPAAFHPAGICEAITRHRPSVLAAVPALLAALTQGVSGIERAEVSSIRLITSTGGRVARGLVQDTVDAFPGAAISLNYGLTETYRTTTMDPSLALSRSDSVGRAIPGVSIAVLNDDQRPAPAGEVGEVLHRGVGVFAGYWADSEATARVRRPDPLWRGGGPAPPSVFTGDLGFVDAEGLLHLVGRRDRQTKSMGVRVSLEEIEDILAESGFVSEVAVLSRPHQSLGDMVLAVVVPRVGCSEPVAKLKRYAQREMSPFMQPREYRLIHALPRTPSGKIDYPAIGRQFAPQFMGAAE